ncbi:MAG: TonB-dependent receptor [Saprospiraceae bacterium]
MLLKPYIVIIIFVHLLKVNCVGQSIDTIPNLIQEITITAYKDEPSKFSPLNIQSIKIDNSSDASSFNICSSLSKVEGVSMLSTGLGIAKPVIRGLYGNRILVLLNGLKFDNQQWQEEHGLGLTDFGLSRVELIKGPIGILYGTEAIGGVVNLIEEEKPTANSHQSDFGVILHSNTLGGMIQAGYKSNKINHWWRLRLGLDNHADYSDGKNNRVLNSRFDGYYLKSTFGFQKNKWISNYNISSSFNRFGFIFNDIYTFITPDKRWSRKLNEFPAHLVLLNIFSSENKIFVNDKLQMSVNAGVQSNERMENEGGGSISLNMHLLTFQNLIKLEYSINKRNKIIFSTLHSIEKNKNYGARKIVPDATLQESNLSVNHEVYLTKNLILENGLGFGEKWIKTYFTPSVNGPDKEVHPFTKFSPYYNIFSGMTFFPSNMFNVKINIASGVRVANLAELSSNGLHEGVFTYEIGNPNFKNEKIYSINLFANYEINNIELNISPFYNYFSNYIYLASVNEQWFGFPVYRYKQQNARQYGGELSCALKFLKENKFRITYSGMMSKTQDGNFTPYIPAQKLNPTLETHFNQFKKLPLSFFTDVEYNFKQENTAPDELKTPSYSIWNMGISSKFQRKKSLVTFGISLHNILNKAYYDHLSRFKYFGLLNMGRNLSINYKIVL